MLGVEFFHHLQAVGALLGRILDGDIQQFLLVPALWDGKREACKLHVGDDIDHDLGDVVATIGLGKALAHLGYRHRDEFSIGLFTRGETVFQGIGLHHCPTPHVHIIDPGGIIVTQQAEHIDVVNHGADNDRTTAHMLQQLVAPLDELGLLKAQFASQLLHLLHEDVHQHMCVTIQDLANLTDVVPVLLLAHQALATPLTTMDVVLQAQAMLVRLDCFT